MKRGQNFVGKKTNFERGYNKKETTRELFVRYECFIFRKTFNSENKKWVEKISFVPLRKKNETL